jgi:hypothetical protein
MAPSLAVCEPAWGPLAAPRVSPVSLHGVESELRSLLRERGRSDLERDALDHIAYTDDGATLYVHVLPKASWSHRKPGQAYVLAFADKDRLRTLARHRDLLHEAWLLLHDEIDDLVRWFDGG